MFRQAITRKIFSFQTCFKESKRFLNLHEYQSKHLMKECGVRVQQFQVVGDKKMADKIVSDMKVKEYVVKAQILAGGRGKGVFDTGFKGGVHLTKDPEKVTELVGNMLGNHLITKQTDKKGVKVNKVMIAEALNIVRETYVAIVMDRETNGPAIICSPSGGVDIEEVVEKSPELIMKVCIDIERGVTNDQAKLISSFLGFHGKFMKKAAKQIQLLYKLFEKVDAIQIEINPFGETEDEVVCFDAKINFDSNAIYRQKEIFSQSDNSEEDPREIQANKYNLNYIGLSGNIGCLVNGAGLAMATMDMIKLCGGEAANFLDLGGGVKEEQIKQALNILVSDPQVKAILINIFGGIVNCGIVAKGIISAANKINPSIPIVVRLEGTNVNEAREILDKSGINIITGNDIQDAAEKVIKAIS